MRRSAVLLLPLLAAACAPAARHATDTPAPAAQAATAAPATALLGDYSVTLSESDFPASASAQARSRSTGTWTISFHQGNHFVVTHNGRQVVEGPYRVSGGQVVFSTGETGPYACNTPATYSWQVNGGQLTLAPVGEDECAGRVLAIATRPFARRP